MATVRGFAYFLPWASRMAPEQIVEGPCRTGFRCPGGSFRLRRICFAAVRAGPFLLGAWGCARGS